MRLIDADALIKDVRENSESYFADDFAEFWVNRQPTIQPEITHRIVGKSKGGMTLWYECERCGEPVDEGDKFCRGCGAKMEVTE